MAESDHERVALRFDNDQPVSVGRIVHFVLRDNKTIRPALVVRVWSKNCLNLQVINDGHNDSRARGGQDMDYSSPHIDWFTSSTYDAGEYREGCPLEPGNSSEPQQPTAYNASTWHWPPRA